MRKLTLLAVILTLSSCGMLKEIKRKEIKEAPPQPKKEEVKKAAVEVKKSSYKPNYLYYYMLYLNFRSQGKYQEALKKPQTT